MLCVGVGEVEVLRSWSVFVYRDGLMSIVGCCGGWRCGWLELGEGLEFRSEGLFVDVGRWEDSVWFGGMGVGIFGGDFVFVWGNLCFEGDVEGLRKWSSVRWVVIEVCCVGNIWGGGDV